MPTAIEISSAAIRCVTVEDGRLTALTAWPVPADADPIQALAAAPLPPGLGKVRVVLQHDDMLLRPMLQPPCPPDRLDRIVRFELQSGGGENGEPVAVAWHQVQGLGGDDLRILALVAKERLIAQIRAALAVHGAAVGAIVPPALGLFHAWKARGGGDGPSALVDLGAKRMHICLADQGELRFLRSVTPGADELVRQVAELRSLSEADARAMVAGLGAPGSLPADIRGLIERQAAAVAAAVTNNLRFAKAQLKLEGFEAKTLWLAGAGGQAPGLADELGKRLGMPVRLINPFAGLIATVDEEQLDGRCALPSPWAAAIGAAAAPGFALDALADERGRRARFWMGDGALRVGVAAAAALMAAGIAAATVVGGRAESAAADLDGLVAAADKTRADAATALAAAGRAADQVRWLDGERRAGRIAGEILAAIAAEQDPAIRHVALDRIRIARIAGAVQVDLDGTAKPSAGLSSDKVLADFEERLRRRYPPIAAVERRSKGLAASGAGLPFGFVLTIPDRAD